MGYPYLYKLVYSIHISQRVVIATYLYMPLHVARTYRTLWYYVSSGTLNHYVGSGYIVGST